MPSLRRLRRSVHRPVVVTGIPGVEGKPLRDCNDDEVRAIVDQARLGGSHSLFDEEWWRRTVFEVREQERNPLEDAGFLPLLGLARSRLALAAAERSPAVRWLFRLGGRLEDRLRRDDYEASDDDDCENGANQIAVSDGR